MELNSSRLCILISSTPSISAQAEGLVIGGYDKHLIESSLAKSGFNPSKVYYKYLHDTIIEELNSLELDLIITLGEAALRLCTDKRGIDKWHLSPLDSSELLNCPKIMPTFDFSRLNRQYEYRMFFFHAFVKAAKSMYRGKWRRKPTAYHLFTEPDDIEIKKLIKGQPILSVDIETSQGTINTMGLAWNPNTALAVRIEPGRHSAKVEWKFWKTIAKYLENPEIKLVLQNNIYESMYFARYGIGMTNIWHDTMWAQKMLFPEFKQGLDVVGRLFTNEIYWKEDGKDWSKIDNWKDHMIYNCKDTANTLEGAYAQRAELKERGMLELYESYMVKLSNPINEMCATGLRVDTQTKDQVAEGVGNELTDYVSQLSKPINPRSPKQKLGLFKDKGYKIPKTRNTKGKFSESVNEISLKKMRLKYPDDVDIQALLKIAKLEKFKSSYIEFDFHRDGIVRYSIKGSGTETLRFSSGTDSWSMGFNAQTIPKKAKRFFLPPVDHHFIQIDLKQAESRYVAYAARDYKLIEMLEDENQDIHSYIAAAIYNCTMEDIIKEKESGDIKKRQLGKKSGHGANYDMQATTFQSSCLKDDLVISKGEAQNILDTYHNLFPGIRRGHEETKKKIWNQGYLENPLGFRRYFYGRRDANTFREAYAFEPQSTIPAITNHLMLHLWDTRAKGQLQFNFHLQVHDSLVLSALPKDIPAIAKVCFNLDSWHPKISFPIGDLVIPIDFETSSTNLGDMQTYKPL